MRPEQQLWIAVAGAVVLVCCSLIGMLWDRRRGKRRNVLLTADHRRAEVMVDYYRHAGGVER